MICCVTAASPVCAMNELAKWCGCGCCCHAANASSNSCQRARPSAVQALQQQYRKRLRKQNEVFPYYNNNDNNNNIRQRYSNAVAITASSHNYISIDDLQTTLSKGYSNCYHRSVEQHEQAAAAAMEIQLQQSQ